MEEYKARKRTDEGVKLFGLRLLERDWWTITCSNDPDVAADGLNVILFKIMDECFPLKHIESVHLIRHG